MRGRDVVLLCQADEVRIICSVEASRSSSSRRLNARRENSRFVNQILHDRRTVIPVKSYGVATRHFPRHICAADSGLISRRLQVLSHSPHQ